MCPRGLVLPGGRQLSKRTNSAISLLFHYTEWCLLACAAASARGLGLAVTRSYGSYDDATLAGFSRRVGAAFVAWPHHRPPQAR